MNKKINSNLKPRIDNDLKQRVGKFVEMQQLLANELGLAIPVPHGEPFLVYDFKNEQLLEVEIPLYTEVKHQNGKTDIIHHKKSEMIQTRSVNDKGGFACMPLKENVPEPKDSRWELTTCPKCGRECWRTPTLKTLQQVQKVEALCTICALGTGGSSDE